jgi:phospholipase C
MPESVEIPAPVSTATAATPRAHGGAWPGGATASAGPSAATALSSPCRDRQHLPRYPGSPEPDNAAQLGELRYAEAPVSEHEVTSWLARWWRRLLPRSQARLIDEAAATAAPGAARLGDIEHVVILMQENRSFDQYFGTMSAVRGFSDPRAAVRDVGGTRYPVFDQFGYRPGGGPDPSGYLQPFRLVSDPPVKDGQTTNDIAHDWPTQHRSWHDGQLDQFVTAHLATDGAENGPLTMGYYTRQDLAFYYALADAFTVCDGYFSSVMGPTDPNRVMAISGTIDPDGKAGGPVVETYFDRIPHYGTLSFETMPERLQAAGISWKVYNHPLAELALSPLPYFKAFTDPFSVTGFELTSRALDPSLDDFSDDVAAGRLPAVSWLIPPLAQCEHPPRPSTASTSSRACCRRWWPGRMSGRRPCCSSCTTRTAGSSITCRQSPLRLEPRVSG